MDHCEIVREKIFAGYPEFSKVSERWKSMGERIVFTNGCFDIFHRGHVEYLAKAADMGDRLIIGLNTDPSVNRLKGTGRPLVDEDSRAFILASLFFVDAVVMFEEDTPENLIREILPDVLVKGDDYTIEEIAGHQTVLEHGGTVTTIPVVPGFSTTVLLERILKMKK